VLGRWRVLINSLIQKDYFDKPLKYSPIERWEVILQQVIHKMRLETKKASWGAALRVAKEKFLDYNHKGKKLEILNRWSILIHGKTK